MDATLFSNRVEFTELGNAITLAGSDIIRGEVVRIPAPNVPGNAVTFVRLYLCGDAKLAYGDYYDVDFRNLANQPTWTDRVDTIGAFTCLEDLAPIFRRPISTGGGGDVTIRDTADTTTVATVTAPSDYLLPQSRIKYKDAADASQELAASDTLFDGTHLAPTTEIPRRALRNSAGTGYDFVAVEDLVSDTVPTAPDVTYQRVDSASNAIGSAVAAPAGTTPNVTCPDATAVVKNLNGTTLITEAILSNASENITAPIPLKFGWGAGDADTLTWTVTDDDAGSYDTYTDDGGSGTITHSKNGGAFAALSGTITLAVADTIVVRRTITTNPGWSRWAP